MSTIRHAAAGEKNARMAREQKQESYKKQKDILPKKNMSCPTEPYKAQHKLWLKKYKLTNSIQEDCKMANATLLFKKGPGKVQTGQLNVRSG